MAKCAELSRATPLLLLGDEACVADILARAAKVAWVRRLKWPKGSRMSVTGDLANDSGYSMMPG